MIDLRSDTVTKPSGAMLAAMVAAPVGDDVYGEDPSVQRLEAQAAELFGKEAGLFCATGSLSNLLGVWLHTEPGREVLCDSQAHIARAEMGAHGALHGVTMRTWGSDRGRLVADDALAMAAVGCGPYLVETACIAVEDTHNFGGGTVQSFDQLQRLSEGARSLGLATHLDGARLANAAAVTGRRFSEYGALFDTVSFCLSKGLGAPVGTVLVGSAEQMARARTQRKRLGAGWRQAGLLAAAGSHALEHNVGRIAEDHRRLGAGRRDQRGRPRHGRGRQRRDQHRRAARPRCPDGGRAAPRGGRAGLRARPHDPAGRHAPGRHRRGVPPRRRPDRGHTRPLSDRPPAPSRGGQWASSSGMGRGQAPRSFHTKSGTLAKKPRSR